MKKIVWTFGLISGGILSAMMLITMPLQLKIGFDHGALIGYSTMVAASLLINVNRFSLHGLYRNRLTRAFLGASRLATDRERTRNRFTDFDSADTPLIADL